jgi:nicotinate-nucleotide--dimethylbenzimidazole phosphoribosyltransferase
MPSQPLSQAAREAFYEVVAKRRDIRLFRSDVDVPHDVLTRILNAAHQAPSVGYSQPWDFVLIRNRETRGRIRESFLSCRAAEAARYAPERRDKYLAYRLEGIVESALNICVTVDLRPADDLVLGTGAQPEALRWSACCAVQNLWLAARAEGVGVGWVSIVEPTVLRRELELPAGIEPVAYLCVGYPNEFPERPMLEQTGWRARKPLERALHAEHYQKDLSPSAAAAPHTPLKAGLAPTLDLSTVQIPPFDLSAAEAVGARQMRLTKPAASLGRLEEIAAWYAGARGTARERSPQKPEIVVFAADHGVVVEGVSAYSSAVTAAMVSNFLAGGAAINALARAGAIPITIVDVGVAGDLSALPAERRARFISAKIRAGTGNLRVEPAMTRTEAEAALMTGAQLMGDSAIAEVDLLGVGEMGIGNTTAAAALLCALTGRPPEETVGRGTGLDEVRVAQKRQVVRDALALHHPSADDPVGALAAVGGLEVAAMSGLMIGAAARRVPVVVDGFISTVAALLAVKLAPGVRPYLCFSHLSAERGHRLACEVLDARPLLDLGLCLGEATGSALAIPLIRAAVAVGHSMATFSTAGIADRL